MAEKKLYAVGQRIIPAGSLPKCLGEACYGTDMALTGMIYGGIKRSVHPHARILSIDAQKARQLPGVRAVITYDDVPRVLYNPAGTPPSPNVVRDEYVLREKVRCFGDRVAAVAADTRELVQKALDLIEVRYEELPSVFSIEDALKEGAPLVHEDHGSNIIKTINLDYGDALAAINSAPLKFSGEYATHTVHAVPLETSACICVYSSDGVLTVYSNSQTPHQDKRNLSEIFSIPESKIRAVSPYVGGAFGQKQQMHQQPVCALLAIITGKPVKMVYSREEEIYATCVRHASKIRIDTGVGHDGRILGLHMQVYVNTGAYAAHGPIVLFAPAGRLPYAIKDYKFEGYSIYSNLPSGGACRGYGNPQLTFAREIHLDEVAEKMGMDPVELRLINRRRTGDFIPALNWQVRGQSYEKCVRAAARVKREIEKSQNELQEGLLSGWGVSFGMHTSGMGVRDMSGAMVVVHDDGSVNVITGAADQGQGTEVIMRQVAAEAVGIEPDRVHVEAPDSNISPYDSGSFSSRQAYVSGNAVRLAGLDARRQILRKASGIFKVPAKNLEIIKGIIMEKGNPANRIELAGMIREYSFGPEGMQVIGKAVFKPKCAPPPQAVCWARVEVDLETGRVLVPDIVISIDVGRAINPPALRGQVEGGVLMGVGYALTEGLYFEEKIGRPINTGYMEYGIPTMLDKTRISIDIVETVEPTGPYGAKSVGEIPTIPVAAAIANAFYHATGVRARSIPLTPDKVIRWLKSRPVSIR